MTRNEPVKRTLKTKLFEFFFIVRTLYEPNIFFYLYNISTKLINNIFFYKRNLQLINISIKQRYAPLYSAFVKKKHLKLLTHL